MNTEDIKRELNGARMQLHEACAVLKLIEYAEGTSSIATLVTAAGGAHRLIDEVVEVY